MQELTLEQVNSISGAGPIDSALEDAAGGAIIGAGIGFLAGDSSSSTAKLVAGRWCWVLGDAGCELPLHSAAPSTLHPARSFPCFRVVDRVATMVQDRVGLARRPHEVFAALFLDAQNRLVAMEELFRGTLTQTSVYPREVVLPLVEDVTDDRLMQGLLVPLQRQDVIRPALDDLRGVPVWVPQEELDFIRSGHPAAKLAAQLGLGPMALWRVVEWPQVRSGIAGAALLIGYILTVAVSVAALEVTRGEWASCVTGRKKSAP